MDNILYLCDHRVEKCMLQCAMRRAAGLEDCRHTTDPAHAVNGTCEHPEREPERFGVVDIPRRGAWYYELPDDLRCEEK